MKSLKNIKIYANLATALGVLTFIFCNIYTVYLIKYLDVKLMVSVLALIAAIQAFLANLIYKNIKKNFPEDKLNNKDHGN